MELTESHLYLQGCEVRGCILWDAIIYTLEFEWTGECFFELVFNTSTNWEALGATFILLICIYSRATFGCESRQHTYEGHKILNV